MAEYGDPDTSDWEFIKKYSPYQNLLPKSEQSYPHTYFTTSTKDDRVHPAHARKMVARMQELGHDVLYAEEIDGGHSGNTNNEQVSRRIALESVYFAQWLGLKV